MKMSKPAVKQTKISTSKEIPQSFFRGTELLFQFRTVSGFYFTSEEDWCIEVGTKSLKTI